MKYSLLILLLLLFSCEKTATTNLHEIEIATNLTNEFYKNFENRDTNAITNYLDESIDHEDFLESLDAHKESYGYLIEKRIWKIETEYIDGKVNSIYFTILLKNLNEKGETNESLRFMQTNNSIKLLSYYYAPPKYGSKN